MGRSRFALMAAAMALILSGAAGRADAQDQATTQGCDIDSLSPGFSRGSDRDRQTTLAHLRAIAANPVGANNGLPCHIQTLRSRYASRAGRQQTLLDVGSGVTGGAGIVSIFAEGAGATTQGYWAAGALLPVLLGSFNANEPTRDLFHGAGQSLDFMTGRMGEMRDLVTRLRAAVIRPEDLTRPTDFVSGVPTTTVECQALRGAYGGIEAGSDETLKVDARAALAACDSALVGREELSLFVSEASEALAGLDGREAADALTLEAVISQRDHDLRYTPTETFGALAAAPFEAAGALLSGENGRAALEALRTQAVFRNLTVDLGAVDLPPIPQVVPVVVLSAKGLANPTVSAAAAATNRARPRHNQGAALAARFSRLARLNRVNLGYDATTRIVTVAASARSSDGTSVPPAG